VTSTARWMWIQFKSDGEITTSGLSATLTTVYAGTHIKCYNYPWNNKLVIRSKLCVALFEQHIKRTTTIVISGIHEFIPDLWWGSPSCSIFSVLCYMDHCLSFCAFSFDHCIVCPLRFLMTSVVSWSLYCLFFTVSDDFCGILIIVLSVLYGFWWLLWYLDHCIVCPLRFLMTSVVSWSLYCLSFTVSDDFCGILIIVLFVLYGFWW
jgi:hypothetical protein